MEIGNYVETYQGIKTWNTCIPGNLKTLASYLLFLRNHICLNSKSIYDEYVQGSIIFVVQDIWDKFITLPSLIAGRGGVEVFP